MNSSKPRILIWGASGHAAVVADILRLQNQFEILGFLDDLNPQRHGQSFCSSTIFGSPDSLKQLNPSTDRIIIAVGNCSARLSLAARAAELGFQLASAIHPRSIIAQGVTIGPGSVIAAGAIINPGAILGHNVIVNTAASVDHHCRIDDGVHIAPGARLAGNVHVGRAAWVGLSAAVLQGKSVGENSLIGAGAVVLDDIPAGVVAYGVPAKIIRKAAVDGH